MLIALVAAGCRSLTTPHPFKHDIKHDAGVAPSPAQAWTPPADAVPPAPAKVEATLPSGVTADTPVTLAQIVDIALANNPTTRQAWLAARAAQANLGSAQSAYYPEIDLNASLSRTQSTALNSVSRQTTFAPSLSLSYLLFDFGGREATVEGAR